MALGQRDRSVEVLVQAGLFIAVSTLALTAAFLGLVALLTASVTGLDARLPFYALALALAFVGGIITFEAEFRDGRRIFRNAGLAAFVTFLLVGLCGEGVAYLVQRPEQLLSSQLLFYFLAAGLIGTGLGYLGLRHWEDLSRSGRGL